MKKMYLLLIIALITSSYVYAQKKIIIGAKANVGLSSASVSVDCGSPFLNTGNNLNYGFGFTFEKPVSTLLSIQSGIEFLNNDIGIDADYSYKDNFTKENASIISQELRIPLLAKFYASNKFSVFCGPFVTYRLGLRTSLHYSSNEEQSEEDLEFIEEVKSASNKLVKDNTHKINYGLLFGFEYEFINKLSVSIYYSKVLNNQIKNEINVPYLDEEDVLHNSNIELGGEEMEGIKPKFKTSTIELGLNYKF